MDNAIDDSIPDQLETMVTNDSTPAYQPSERTEALYQRWIKTRSLTFPCPVKDKIPARDSTVLPRDELETVKGKKNKKNIDSDTVYEDLLDLLIYALVSVRSTSNPLALPLSDAQHQPNEDGFGHEVLVQWQMTDFSCRKFTEHPFPHLNLVEKAYRELPSGHKLLGHIARFFACFQATHECETPAEYRPRGLAFEKFLYAMNFERKATSQ
jgi:hypothetical protein